MPSHRIVLLTAALALAAPAAASAEDFCVGGAEGCSGTAVTAVGFRNALAAAQNNGTSDRFFLPDFLVITPTSFTHNSPEKVEIIGKGVGKSGLRGLAGPATVHLGGNSESSISDVSLEATGSSKRALMLEGTRATRVAYEQAPGTAPVAGMTLIKARLEQAEITMHEPLNAVMVGDASAITDSKLTSHDAAAVLQYAGDLTIRRSTLAAKYGVLAADGHVSLSDTLIDLRYQAGEAYGILATTAVATAPASVVVDAERVTIAGSGASSASSSGIGAYSDADKTATVNARDVAIGGVPHALVRSTSGTGVASIHTDHSAYSTVDLLDTGNGEITQTDRVDAEPGFVDPAAGDFRLKAGSALVDGGSPAALAAEAVDRDGAPRHVDGDGDCTARTDIGAYERVGLPCRPPTPPPAPVADTNVVDETRNDLERSLTDETRTLPRAVVSKLTVRKRDRALRFSLSHAATLQIVFAKRTRKGTYKTVKSIRGIGGKKGVNTITHRLRLRRGSYRATVTAITPAGRPVSKRFTVGPARQT
jgi:hypothetical protein